VIKHDPITGWINEVEQFIIRVRTSAAGHTEAGYDNSTTLNITVRVRGGTLDSENDTDYSLLYLGVVIAIVLFVLYLVFFRMIRRE
jgi:hypothetical protein